MAQTVVDKLTAEENSTLTNNTLVPYRVKSVTSQTMTIDKVGIPNTFIRDQVAIKPDDPTRDISGATEDHEPLSESHGVAPYLCNYHE